MRITYLLAGLTLSAGLVGAAQGRNEPPPKPSGIVVHLFGPGSIMSNVMPSGSSSPGQGTGSGTTGSGGTGTAGATGNQNYVEPTWGDVAHQMFVTGDPSQEGQAALAKGRPGNGGQ